MKTAPGALKKGKAILGREREIADLWRTLEGNSVLFTAERRVGKSSLIEKMTENPADNWVVLLCYVESKRHPSELVGEIYRVAREHRVLSRRANWLEGFGKVYAKLAGAEAGGWRLPPVENAWKRLLTSLVEDLAGHDGSRIVIVLDEFPHMLSSMIEDGRRELAVEVLDTLRELRQRFQAAGNLRFLFTGSIGLHLVISELKQVFSYTGNPMNDVAQATLDAMGRGDVETMCRKYLEEEGISRSDTVRFMDTMCKVTDCLPLYVEYVCDRFQKADRRVVTPADIEREVKAMLLDPQVEWFADAAERIRTRYKSLKMDGIADAVMCLLCKKRGAVPEGAIMEALLADGVAPNPGTVQPVFELLLRDHYLSRSIVKGSRTYRFKYEIMRRWWQLNRG